MEKAANKILVWLPSPMGDAILCTPALRAIRKHFDNSQIIFLSSYTVGQILSPCDYNNAWLINDGNNPFETAKILKKNKFTQAVLFKNSFSSALACFLSSIPKRTGYARDFRSSLLTDRLFPPKTPDGQYKSASMIDYYLKIAEHLGCPIENRFPLLEVSALDKELLYSKYPQLQKLLGMVFILVPGGAFGPSKQWPAPKFAQTADRLIAKYRASVFISVSPSKEEKRIADEICGQSKNKITNLAENPLTIGELKFLFSIADLVITNDTGPRHIAIAFKRDVITLFGPNDPAWTQTGWEREIKITGRADCVPCAKKKCKRKRHECMESISVDMVCEAADKLLAGK
jgi:heptosyltransferase II